MIRNWMVVVIRSPQASRQTREFVWQERESLGSAATASETIMSTSKSKCPSKTPHCFSKNIQPLHVHLTGARGPCDQIQTLEVSETLDVFPITRITRLFCLFCLCRTLTDRQRALLTSYAEDETDVEGTVNGVTATTTGNRITSCLRFWNWARTYLAWGPADAVLISVQAGAAVVSLLGQGKASMTWRKEIWSRRGGSSPN